MWVGGWAVPEGVVVEVGVGGVREVVFESSSLMDMLFSERVLEMDSVCVHLATSKNSPSDTAADPPSVTTTPSSLCAIIGRLSTP